MSETKPTAGALMVAEKIVRMVERWGQDRNWPLGNRPRAIIARLIEREMKPARGKSCHNKNS